MKPILRNILALGLAAFLTIPAFAADKIVLTDGTVHIGTIIKKTESVLQIRVRFGNLEKTLTFFMGDVAEISTVEIADEDKPRTTGNNANIKSATTTEKTTTKKAAGEVPYGQQILVLPLTGMVGMEFRHNEIEKVAEKADKIKEEYGEAPIILLEIESGGGYMFEMYDIRDSIVDIKKRHRVVVWIKTAISAACATALHCDEIYFKTDGNAGAMTGYAGTTSLQGDDLLKWLNDASAWAEAGGRDGAIARAMIDEAMLLSYDKDEETGEVTFYDDLSGKYILSEAGQNLSFTSSNAEHCGFSDGIADTKEELAKLLDLPAWVEVEDQFGVELHEEWNETLETGRIEVPKLYYRIGIVQGSSLDILAKIGKQIDIYKKLIKWWDRAENLLKYEIGIPPKEELERLIEQLRYQAAEIRKARRRGGG